MRLVLYLLLSLLWFGFNVAAEQPEYLVRDEARAPEEGSVRGITRIAGPVHEPLGDVTLQWQSVQGDRNGEVRSDELGRYAITGLEPGQYRLHVYRKGMIPKRNLMISILPGKETNYDIALQPEEREMPAEIEREPMRPNEPQPELRQELERLRRRLSQLGEDSPDAWRIRDKIGDIEHRLSGDERRGREGARGRNSEPAARDDIREVDERVMQLRRRMGGGDRGRSTREPARPGRMPRMQQELAIFVLEHVPAEHAAEIIIRFAGERPIVVGDPWSNTLFVKTSPAYLQDIERILEHLDVPRRFREAEWHPEHPFEEAEWEHHAERDEGMEHHAERDEGMEHHAECDEGMEHHAERDEGMEHHAERDEGMEHHAERDEGMEHHAERGERATVQLTLRPSDGGRPQLLMGGHPISLDELETHLAHLDEPWSWRLKIQVSGEIPDDVLREVVGQIEELARAKRIERIEIRAVQWGERAAEEKDED